MTNHQEWKLLISAYFDDELSSQEKDTVNDHLVDCPACQKYLKELQTLSLRVKALKNESLSADLEQRLNNLNRTRTQEPVMKKSTFMNALKVTVPILFVGVIALSLQMYIKRGVQGRLRAAADDIGNQYSKSNTRLSQGVVALSSTSKLSSLGEKKNYEEYYANSDYTFDRAASDKSVHSNVPSVVGFTQKTTAPSTAAQIMWQDSAYYRRANGAVSKDAEILKGGLYSELRANEMTVTNRTTNYGNLQKEYWGNEGANKLENVRASGYESVRIHQPLPTSNTEQYDLISENEFLKVIDNPLSTFSIDVDTASYANIRRFLNNNQMPPRDAVRIEEMINYFQYNYPQPGWNQPFSITLEQGICPWNQGHHLVLVGLQGKELSERQTPPSNLVFLIDVSGSMSSSDKLPLLKESLKMMVAQLRPEERVSIVVYAGAAGLVLDSAPGYNKGLIMSAIDNLQAGGSTAGGQGIELAYAMARKNFLKNGNNRVILATDGDFNVGVSNDSQLVQLIEEKRKDGIFLTVLGFGTGNYQDGKMEKLADKGNGNYFYIDTLNEGKKVLVDELGSTLIAIAKDVKIQIEFNPSAVKAYRLIGYENRKLAKEDFNDDTKDAGELGAGHTVTALYEIIPAVSWETTNTNVDPLKYQKQIKRKSIFTNDKEMMTVKLRYKEPKAQTSQLITKVLNQPTNTFGRNWFGSSDNLQFASAVAEFGMLLRDSNFKGVSSYQSVLQRVQNSAYNDAHGYKNELIGLIQKASTLDHRQSQVPVQQPYYQNYPIPNFEQGGYNQKSQ
ncbi:MAG: von Willebrand factor type A domain-containing protein [Candidatus Omnitrophica bacterium]|nr:von Willebrand factor type A domain-containing protein [Candidatus Omnitrophota bacterium]